MYHFNKYTTNKLIYFLKFKALFGNLFENLMFATLGAKNFSMVSTWRCSMFDVSILVNNSCNNS